MIVGSLEIQLMAGIARLQRDMSAARQTVSSATASMERAANAARTALASIGAGLIGGAGLSQIVRMTDEYTKFTAQLKLGTNSQKEYARAMEDVKRISTAAQNDMGTTGVLYARIIASTRELGVTQSQVAKVTETVNLALAATGASSSESASAMLQLSQAFGSGVLRGEEFNAVYEAAPELLRILAKSLDIPIGRLRKLAEEGALTSDKLVAAFSDDQVIAKLRENVAQITTFSGAMTVFRNNLVEVIGQQLHASGVVTTFTSAILAGAGAIRTMIDVLATAAKVAAAYVALLVIAPPLITATAAAMTRLGHAMAVYAMNVMIGQTNTIKFNQALFGTSVAAGLAAGAITRVGLTLNSVFALFLGWQIGEYLNDQFVEVEVAGEIMAGGLLEGWEMLKFGAKVAFDGMTVFAREAVATIASAFATWFEFVAKGLRLIGDDVKADALVAYADKIRTATAVSGTFAGRTAEARAEMEKNIKVIEQDTDRRIAAAFAADREGVKLTASAEARVKAGAAVTTMTEEQKKAYESAIKSANDYIENLRRERQELGLDDDQLRMLNASRAAAVAPTAALRREIMEGALALTQEKQAVEAAKLAREQYDGAIKAQADARAQEQSSLQDSIDRMQVEVDTYGMGAAAVTRYNLAKLEARRADLIAADNYGTEMLAVMDSIDKLTQLEGLQNVRDDLDSLFEIGRVETFGQALRDAFGNAGSALGALTGAFQDYSDRQTAAEMARAKVRLKYGDDEKRIAREVGKINALEERDRVSAYADMAGAAKGFFKENSAGYKVMEGTERAFRAMELASQMQSLYTHLFVTTTKATATATGQGVETAAVVAGEAARNTAKVPGVFMSFMSALGPWGMAAAAVAIAAVLGGAFSGGSSVSLSQKRQEKQGTGTVFGDETAKSESILKAIEAVEKNTYQGLAISQGMLSALTDIRNSIGSFAALVVRDSNITGKAFAGVESNGAAYDTFRGIAGFLDPLMDGFVGKFLGKVGNAIFGGKRTLEDSGFTIDRVSLAGILGGGLNAFSYADIKKDGGLFRSDDSWTERNPLGAESNRRIAGVILSLRDGVLAAGDALGLAGDSFTQQIDSFNVDLGKISFKDMKPEEIEKELQAIFSALGDQMAQFAVGGLEPFQRVGEGYLETLTRVAAGYQAVDVVTSSLGMSFNAVGLASVGARERLIDLAGGLDEFTAGAEQFLNDFFSDRERADSLRARITPTLDQYGIKTGTEDALQQFRSVVTGLDLTTEAGATAYATLIKIAPAFKEIADVDASIFEERADLQKELDQLTLTETQLLAQQRDALHESNRALFDQIQAIKAQSDAVQAARDAAEILMASVDSTFSVLQKVVDRQKRALQVEIDARRVSVQEIESLSQALRSSLGGMSATGFDVEDRQSAQAQIQAALAAAKASGVLPDAEILKGALSVLGKDSASQFATQQEYLRDFYATRNGIEDLAGLTDDALSVEQRSLQALEDQVTQYDRMLEQFQEQIDVAKGQSTIGISIEQAVRAVEGALLAAKSNPVNAATSAITDAYKSALGRAPDTAGLDYYRDRAAGGASIGDIVGSIQNSPEAQIQKLYQDVFGRSADAGGLSYWMDRLTGGVSLDAIKRAFLASDETKARVPGFAGGGDHAGGWRIVGENGPELEATGPTRIFNAGQTRDLMSRLTSPADNSAALAAAVDRLSATVERQERTIEGLKAAADQTQRNTRRVADGLEVVTNGFNAMRTKEQTA